MKLTKLSLVAALAVSSAFAGGDIAPVEPVVEALAPVVEAVACNSNTTISGKAQAYYYSDDSVNFFDAASSSLGTAVTLDVAHKITNNITANFSAVGFTADDTFFEGQKSGAYFNVANLTATYGDTTAILGRQLVDTPMFGGFDWLLAPGAFEAYTLVNNSISNLTLVGAYVTRWRANASGPAFGKLDGNNWTVGAVYANDDVVNANFWYYNIDAYGANKYTQFYVDASKSFGMFNVAGQYAATNYASGLDSSAFGIKVGATVSGFDLSAAYNDNTDRAAGYVGRDGLYTSSWNSFAAKDIGSSWKVAAATELAGLAAEVSYADYATTGNELDLILGYGITDCVSLDAIYTNTKYTEAENATNALELIATYKF